MATIENDSLVHGEVYDQIFAQFNRDPGLWLFRPWTVEFITRFAEAEYKEDMDLESLRHCIAPEGLDSSEPFAVYIVEFGTDCRPKRAGVCSFERDQLGSSKVTLEWELS